MFKNILLETPNEGQHFEMHKSSKFAKYILC